MHFGEVSAIMALISIVLITLRFALKKSNKKARCILLVLWLISLTASGAFIGLQANESYVPSDSVIAGYWVERYSGRFLGYKYDSIGGEGAHPIVASALAAFSWAVLGAGFGFGLSIIISKERSAKSKIVTLAIFSVFIFYVVRRLL